MFSLDSALGIEVGPDRLILASVKKGLQDYRLNSHLVVEGYLTQPRPELLARIQEFARSNGFNRENIIAGLPRDWVVLRDIELPIEVEENLEGVIRAQVERYEPIEDEHSYHDFQVRSRDTENGRLGLEILMAKKEIVDQILDLLKEIDLYPAVLTVGSLGLQAALTVHEDGLSKKSGAMILRLDPGRVELVIHTPGGGHFSEVLTFEEENPSPDVVLKRVAELLTPDVERFSSFSKLYLAGPLAGERSEEYTRRLADTELLAGGLSLRRKAISERTLDELTPAIGLAVSGMARRRNSCNLIPPERRIISTRASLTATYILGVLLILTLGVLLARGYLQGSALAAEIDSELARMQPEVEQIFSLRDQVEAKKAELAQLKALMGEPQGTLLVLRDLTERIPDDTYLQNLQIQGDQLTMQGYSVQASALLSVLTESPYLESVKTNWITQDPRVTGKERFNFTAKVK